MEGVKGVHPIDTQPKLLQIQRKCQDMCDWEKLRSVFAFDIFL